MSDHPILFSAPMVRALLAGTKTQDRRVAKITTIMGDRLAVDSPDESLVELEPGEFRRGIFHYASTAALSGPYRLRYKVGDRLWVKEAGNWRGPIKNEIGGGSLGFRFYAADSERGRSEFFDDVNRPAISMPRWASRITLTVTDVRVQRLQDISEDDAIAEGVDLERYVPVSDAAGMHASGEAEPTNPIEEYRDLWVHINGHGSWEANPWVMAVSFDVQNGNIDQVGK